ncbi:DinB family protein [Aquimarina pacifica]|uniref:DinB family protein n=1 Tax=Aquimarina pacifica TaxID=1296415 RepID=UPI0004705D32|nr:DUF1572 family protein [Aquimarina pacifica]
MEKEIVEEFIEQIIYRLDESTRMVTLSFDHLSDDDIWKRSNDLSNSVGNLVLHLCGNIRQYAISSLGNSEDTRVRDQEFDATEGFSKKDLLDKLIDTVETAKRVLKSCAASELLRKREVQGFTFSGIGIAIHVTEHYSYHTGQIAFWTKQLKNHKSLGFYDGINLNKKNKEC